MTIQANGSDNHCDLCVGLGGHPCYRHAATRGSRLRWVIDGRHQDEGWERLRGCSYSTFGQAVAVAKELSKAPIIWGTIRVVDRQAGWSTLVWPEGPEAWPETDHLRVENEELRAEVVRLKGRESFSHNPRVASPSPSVEDVGEAKPPPARPSILARILEALLP